MAAHQRLSSNQLPSVSIRTCPSQRLFSLVSSIRSAELYHWYFFQSHGGVSCMRRRRTYRTRGERSLYFTSSKWRHRRLLDIHTSLTGTSIYLYCVQTLAALSKQNVLKIRYIPSPRRAQTVASRIRDPNSVYQLTWELGHTALCHARIKSTRIGHGDASRTPQSPTKLGTV